jgi:uncharacterized membrane protein
MYSWVLGVVYFWKKKLPSALMLSAAVFQGGEAVVHLEFARIGRIKGIGVVRQDGVVDAEQVQDALQLADVADVGVKAQVEVELAVGGFGFLGLWSGC